MSVSSREIETDIDVIATEKENPMKPISDSEAEGARADAVSVVAQALARFPNGRALAGQLETEITTIGISDRQARRWIRWAASDPQTIVRLPRDGAGTTYCLVGHEPPALVALTVSPAPAPELDAVPQMHRHDVAMVIGVLLKSHKEVEARSLARAVAEGAGRSILWGLDALETAVSAARRGVISTRSDVVRNASTGGLCMTIHHDLVLEIDRRLLAEWGAPMVFRLPTTLATLERHLRRRFSDPAIVVTPGLAEVTLALIAAPR
jgi:hypothetical protein